MKTQMQQTSIFAYREMKNIGAKQRFIYEVIRNNGPMTNLDIADLTRLPINRITGRTNELVAGGLVEEAYKAPSRQTGRQSVWWRIKE